MRRLGGLVLGCAVGLIACGESDDDTGGAPLTGGSGGRATSGAAGSTGGSVMIGPGGGMDGVGAFGGHLSVSPPPTVNLETCASVVDDGTDDTAGACFYCCAEQDFENEAFFAGKCACGMPASGAGATVCASQTTSDACFACCNAAAYSGGRFDPNTPGSCDCLHHSDSSLCADSRTDATPRDACAVCCINHGYVGSFFSGSCTCSEG